MQMQQPNLLRADLWEATRQFLGVESPVGCVPREDVYIADAKELHARERRGAPPAAGDDTRTFVPTDVMAYIHELVEDETSTRDIADLLRDEEGVKDVLRVVEGETEASPSLLCPLGIEYVCITPYTPSGRTIRFAANGHTHTAGGKHPRHAEARGVIDADTLYIIPFFAAAWNTPMANHAYQQYYKETLVEAHTHFVGTAGQLFTLLDNIEHRLRRSVDILPPWRMALAWKRALTAAVDQSFYAAKIAHPLRHAAP